uniref:Cadherin domain-containing protein n=1 Tax=Apteryx owenii TaxID=8824 RepID=A0A8B9S4G9_APTOW
SLAVDEGLPAGTPVGDIRAGLPPDAAQPGGFLLSEGSGESAVLADFHVQTDTGIIRTARRLDRERRARYSFVAATLRGEMVQVEIAVTDVNDHPPRFPRDWLQLNISELTPPGTTFRLPGARDPDAGRFGTQGYTLLAEGGAAEEPPLFQLRYGQAAPGASPEPLDLVLLRRLDRERADAHGLVVEAWDGGSPRRRGRLRVAVRVLDENDNAPAFGQAEYRARLREDAPPGTAVCRLLATDPDLGANGEVRYAINRRQSDADGYFAVEERSGVLRLRRPLDREARALHRLVVEARDGSAQPEVSSALVSVVVLDVNDNRPVIRLLYLTESGGPRVSEAPSAKCSSLMVTDTCIHSVFSLGFEVFFLNLAAKALGLPQLHACSPWVISLLDLNSAVQLVFIFIFIIFLQVKATDADADQFGEIEYFLYDVFHYYEKSEAFQIDPHTGQICVSQDIDREGDPTTYDLLVKATDGGGLSAQAFVRIEIEDINDNQPIFEQAIYVTSISSHTQPGTEIINVVATDRDSGIYGIVTYELIPGEFSSLFTVDTFTGIIYLISALSHLEHSVLFLTVSAQDGGGLSSAINAAVTVNILQTTLAPAIFERSRYAFSVPEDVPEDSPVGTVKAREPLNSLEVVSYRISSGDPYGRFSIDPQFGIIRTKKQLDHETQSFVVLTVQSQLGSSPVYSSTQVNISVIDVNDNPPVFLTKSGKVIISHTLPPGTAVYIAHAEDKDSGLNGAIKYSIASNQSSAFSIDPSLGVVNLTRTVFADKQQEYTLHIAAEDHGSPPLSSLLKLSVIIEEQKMGPTLAFENLVYQVEISEASSLGAQILQVQAHSLDPHHVTSKLTYSLESSTDSVAFGISSDTGWIYLRKHLNYECAQMLSFRALVSTLEDKSSRQNASTSVIVNVLDENDNCPMFIREGYFFEMEENPVPRGVVGTVTAVDKDSGRNGQLSYFLLSDGKYFKMNSNTGEIINWVALDHERQTHHQLTILVTDHGSPRLNATTTVYISVTDINDNKPVFPQIPSGKELNVKVCASCFSNLPVWSIYVIPLPKGRSVFSQDFKHFVIPENFKPAQVLNSIKLPDNHLINNRKLHFSITKEDDDVHFEIDSLTGDLFLSKELDYETASHFLLQVTIKDYDNSLPRNTTVFVSIDVEDQNDHSPYFQDDFVVIGIEENVPVGTLVYSFNAKDGDGSFLNSKIQYSMEMSSLGENPFLIHPLYGTLITAFPLDREITRSVILTVSATDQAINLTDRRLDSLTAKVVVLDINDNSPGFTSSPLSYVMENVEVGFLVHHIVAKDPDEGRNGQVTYHILSGNEKKTFILDKVTGLLSTSLLLDHEIEERYNLTIMALDDGTPALSATQILTIIVLDVNDERPIFLKQFYETAVCENQDPGEFVVKVEAVDRDSGNFSPFAVNFIVDIIDQSNLAAQFRDSGTPSLSSTVTVICKVLDENDYSPKFLFPVSEIRIPENQQPSIVHIALAVDEDAGNNGTLRYEIIGGNVGEYFTLNSTSGKLLVTRSLDREDISNFTLVIECHDLGNPPRSSTAQLYIAVLDENDNNPLFAKNHCQVSVREDLEEGSAIVELFASDKDDGLNGEVMYSLIDDTFGAFAIDSVTGSIVTTQILDRETKSQYTFRAVASDCSIHLPRSTTISIVVHIDDVNDNDPVFLQNPVKAFVPVETSVNETVATVRAEDMDLGPNGAVVFSLMVPEPIFQIDRNTGDIILQEPLVSKDFSTRLLVMALDQGISPRTATAIVAIFTEEQEEEISFSHSLYEVSVPENSAAGGYQSLIKFHNLCFFPDYICHISVSFNKTGVITVKEPKFLDYEVKNKIHLLVLAENSLNSVLCEVMVWVQDVNDNVPKFEQSYYKASVWEGQIPKTDIIQVRENMSSQAHLPVLDHHFLNIKSGALDVLPGFTVTQVSAADADSRPALQFGFTEDNSPGMKFAINQHTGVITVVEPLDFEETSVYKLGIIVSDSVHQTEAELTILILDVNDNPPVFTQDLYQVGMCLPELISVDAAVLTITAVDRDSEHNGMISYRMLSSSEGFSIDPKNGSVFTTKPVIHLGKNSIFQLLIEAKDSGNPALSAVMSVEIQIEDVNNYAPKFTRGLYNLSVSEDASVGESILMFSAIDCDWTHENTHIEYSIIDGNADNLFSVETSLMESETSYKLVGNLVLSNTLDRETASSHCLVLLASDHGTPSLNSTATVLITVLDVNDNPPVFNNLEYHIHVKESIPIGSHIIEVSANDCDAGANAEITYAIISGNDKEYFRLDGKTGSVDLMKTLDYEDTAKFTLNIQATDGGADVKNVAFSVVLVSVLDDNDYVPLFLFPSFNCIVSENLPTFSFVCTVTALDFDKGSYGHITYSIQSSCLAHRDSPRDHDMFFINPLTGDIHTKQMFDYESQNRYCLIIQAKDKGDSLATVTVQVDIEGRDEFDPVFTQDQYFFNLPEKNEADQLLGKVTASDNDGGLDGVVHYSLLKSSPFFSVNQTSGNIYLTQTVHRKKNGRKRKDNTLELLVRAHSPKIDSKFTVCTVLVNVSNFPENYPIGSAYSLIISLSISFIVFLLLAISLIALILRYKRKDMMNSCVKKEAATSSATNSGLASEDKVPKDCQEIQSTESSMLPMGTIAEWLSLVGIREKEDVGNPCRHSDSSGHGSTEGETAEDEEVKRINEHPCRKSSGSASSERGSQVPDSGIPRESDQLSSQSGETDVVAISQSMESMQAIKDEGGEEACDTASAHNNMLSQTLKKIQMKEKDIMTDFTREYMLISDTQDSQYDSLAILVTSEDLRGSCNWDYLFSWEPRFQPLASVFSDIAELKDENVHIHSFPKEKKSFIFPPPLITSVAQPAIRTVPPRMPNITSGQAYTSKYPRSPLAHNLGYPPPTMTPSFSPSLSLLTVQTPTTSPVISDGRMIGTCLIGPSHELATEEEIQV